MVRFEKHLIYVANHFLGIYTDWWKNGINITVRICFGLKLLPGVGQGSWMSGIFTITW